MDSMLLNWNTAIWFAAAAVVSYLLGSINFAIIFTRIFAKKDVRDVGSGNAGMTNAFRAGGKITGILTLIFDFGKAIAAVSLGRWLLPVFTQVETSNNFLSLVTFEAPALYGAMWCGLFVLIGHLYPVFFKFKGGKGVLTSAGTILLIDWRMFLIVLGVFMICFAITRIISISSMIGSLAFPVSAWFLLSEYPQSVDWYNPPERVVGVIFAAIITLIIIVKHKDNIKRLLKGEEKRMNFGKK